MKKTVIWLSVLAILGGIVFFFGWVQFAVPAGSYGVLVSKTGGVNPKPIVPARFRWQWERLLPTNAKILVFNLSPATGSVEAAGTLPSGDLYSRMLEGKGDFSWQLKLDVTARVSPDYLPVLVRERDFREQAALDTWLAGQIASLGQAASGATMHELTGDAAQGSTILPDSVALGNSLAQAMGKTAAGKIEIVSVKVVSSRIPDFALYSMAKSAYADYETGKRSRLAAMAAKEADSAMAEYLEIERLSRLGELLTKYPILIEYLAVTGDHPAEAFKAVKDLR